MLERAVAAGVTPGAAVVVGDGDSIVAEASAGRLRFCAGPEDEPPAATADRLYDVASVTKPLATAAPAMVLAKRGRLELDAPLAPWIPELRAPGAGGITFRHALGHATGLPDHMPLYRRLWAGERRGAASRREALFRMAAAAPLAARPGARVLYSDLGYILLGLALERMTGERLDALAERLVFGPLGMTRTCFVDLDQLWRPEPVAATELCAVRGLVRGEVHDDNAHAGGGVFGHAGVFSTARDVASFAAALGAAAAGGRGVFDPDVARAFFRERAGPETTWRLGFDTPSPGRGVSMAGDRFPARAVGHLGFTGASFWLDPEEGRYVVLLSNRVHPSRAREEIRPLRRAIMDTAAAALGYGERS